MGIYKRYQSCLLILVDIYVKPSDSNYEYIGGCFNPWDIFKIWWEETWLLLAHISMRMHITSYVYSVGDSLL